uniref:G domain-containing protein n=1 Tax=Panagrolaimus sp. ES5 TaxID=591445 RepID=A0AC34GT46_9BILA
MNFSKTPSPQPPEYETLSEEEYKSAEEDEEETENEEVEYNNDLFKAQSEVFTGEKKTLNILVLGETGVGKSTWINGIANYMTFNSLEDALNASQPVCLIPCKFNFYQTNESKIEVKIEPPGQKDKNEAFSDEGQSSTQDPKTYQFETSKYIINIIDTPGIGDCRGPLQDKENTRKILSSLGQYKELHAICFLFKANEARLTVSFRYCIGELLMQLHKEAVHNIIFFFTNARGTFYKPGDTMNPLSKFINDLEKERGLKISLDRDRICCTDNEAFRLVCAYFNGAQFTQSDFDNFAGSWKQSADQTHRFIEFAAKQPPHIVDATLSINKARTIIFHLAKPLSDVNELIESNIKVFDDRKIELQNTANSINDLKQKLKIPQIGIEVQPLDHPKTVCTGPDCIETQSLPNTGQLQTIYKQVCHDHCYLDNVDVERIPEPNLINCTAMDNGKCVECLCEWRTHMHIRFEQIKTTVEVEDINTKDLIKKNEDATVVKQQMIKDCEKTITELKAEQQSIIQTSLRFGGFLQKNAIIPYNDAFEKYVEQTITEEEKCISVGGDRTKLGNLKNLLSEYRQQKMLLSEAKDKSIKSDDAISSTEVENLKKQLFALKHTGKILENLFKATEDGNLKHNSHVTVRYVPPRKPRDPPLFGTMKKKGFDKNKLV